MDGLAESEGMNGQCSLCAIWDVPLTAEQVAVFNARPYALVEPPVFQMAFVPSVNPVFEPGNPLLWL
ncbi:hypothetical protein [Oceanidesulfovibrio marinus]|uniref:Uncharacterized protein n=1 Tax=Oceanidesulfovibrio marinus TaxID=370038 RepID=A0A6P1ZKI9_9BACT|nr:hypothetical protein [Oceanidesulfovibrio marinus]TVM35604.1 hypothetical protein DQK91_02770 [Oceanidesulfovibrio marinus]